MTMRRVTSLTIMHSFILLMVTSVVLYVIPHGRVAYWSDWRWLGLSKTDWGNLHIVLGALFLIGVFVHTWLNWTPVVNYMRNRAREFTLFTADFNAALLITLAFAAGTYLGLPPFQWLLDLNTAFKDAGTAAYGEPPYGHAELSSVGVFAKKVDLDPAASVTRLRDAGVEVQGLEETLLEISEKNGITPQQVYERMKPPASDRPAAVVPLPDVPPAGIGRLTLDEISATYGIERSRLITFLSAEGFKVTGAMTLRQLAEQKTMAPPDLYTLVREAMLEPQP